MERGREREITEIERSDRDGERQRAQRSLEMKKEGYVSQREMQRRDRDHH